MKIRLKNKKYLTSLTISIDKYPNPCYSKLTEPVKQTLVHLEVKTINSGTIFHLLTDMKKNQISRILDTLSPIEFTTLHVLKRGHFMNPDQEITVSNLANYTDSSLPAVSRTLSQLEKSALITRNIGEKDRRAISVALTQEGEKMLTHEETRLKLFSDSICETMGTEDMELLISLVGRFLTASEQGLLALKEQTNHPNP